MVCDSPFSPSLCYPIRRPVRRPIHRPVVETRDPELARDICRTLLLRIRCCLEVRTLEEDTQMALGGGAHRDNLMITPIPWCRACLPRLLWLTLICLQRPVSTVVAVCFVSSTLTTICTHTRFSSPLARALLLSLLVSCSCRSPRKPGVFASASGDCTIKIWDSNAPRSMCTIAAHPHEVCGWSVAGCA